LHARERFWIDNYKDIAVNKQVPGRTDKEYRKDNKEKITVYKKQHYEKNKEKNMEKSKKYREDNKKEMNEKKGRKQVCVWHQVHQLSQSKTRKN
jgi:hypothetical protein